MAIFRGANPFDMLTPGIKKLLLAIGGMFLIQMLLPGQAVEYLALRPQAVLQNYWIWQLFTYSFLHGNFWHLFFNVFALWMFGPHIEAMWGTRRFLTYYAACVIGAAACQFIFAPAELMMGASGGIYGLLIAFGLMFPDSVIYLFFFFPLRAIQAVMFIALLTLVSAVGSGGSRIAHFAHLGGMLTGFLYMKFPEWWSQWRYRLSRGRVTISKQKKGRGVTIAPSADEVLSSEVDRILEKISSQGVGSLTEKEHETMQRYAKRKQ